MATWDEMAKLTWDDLAGFTWDDIAQIRDEVWPLLVDLGPSGRERLRAGLSDGSLPPGLVAAGEPDYDEAQIAALVLIDRFQNRVRPVLDSAGLSPI